MARKAKDPHIERHTNGNFYVLFNAGGRSQRKALRTKDLEVATARFEGWLKEGKIDYEVIKDPTISECLDLWYNQWIVGRVITENRYPSIINNLNAYFSNKRISEVTRVDSQNYITLRRKGDIGQCPASNGTIRLELQRLRACYKFMREIVEPKEQRIPKDNFAYVELPPESLPRDRVLDKEELDILREACVTPITGRGRYRSNRISRVGRFIMIAMETAQRKSAIVELTWDQIDFTNNRIVFNKPGRAQTKKKRPTIPISPKLRPFLEIVKSESINDYVLDKDTGVYEAVVSFAKKLNIEGVHPHVFRHTWATHAVMRGVSLNKIAQFLGDRVKTIEDNYAHLQPDYLDDVFE